MPPVYAYYLPHSSIFTSQFSIRNPHRKELYAALESAWRYHDEKFEDTSKLPHAGVRVQVDEHGRFEVRVVKGHVAEDGSVRAKQVPSMLSEPECATLERLVRSAIKWESADK